MTKRNVAIFSCLCLVLMAFSASAALFGQTYLWVHVGGTAKAPKAMIDENGKGTFTGGIDAYGGKLRVQTTLFRDEDQVGLLTGGLNAGYGSSLIKGSFFAIDPDNWESLTGMQAILSIEDLAGYGAHPMLVLAGADGEGLRMHYDLAHTLEADLFDSSEDTVLRIKNSDGSHKASLSVEGPADFESLSLGASSSGITQAVGDLQVNATLGNVTINVGTATTSHDLQVRGQYAGSGGGIRTDGDVSFGENQTSTSISTRGNTNLNAYSTSADSTVYVKNTDGSHVANLKVEGIATIEGKELNVGDGGGFSGMKFNAGATTLDFYIDGTKIAHFNTNGTVTDDVP